MRTVPRRSTEPVRSILVACASAAAVILALLLASAPVVANGPCRSEQFEGNRYTWYPIG